MSKGILSILKYVFFLLFGIFLLWLVFRKVNLQEVLFQFKHANYWWILFSFVFAALAHLARAIRWNILIRSLGYRTRTSTTFYAVMIGYFVNLAVPRLGEISRCGALSQKDKLPVNALFGSVVAERVFDTLVLLLLIFLVVISQLELLGEFLEKNIFTPLYLQFEDNLNWIVFAFFAFLFVIILGILLFRLFLPRFRNKSFYIRINEFVAGFMNGVKTIQRLKNKGSFFFWTFIIWLMYTLMSYVVFFALKETAHLSFIDAITIMVIGSLGMVAPVPGGIGAYHFFVSLILFELYGIQKATAASWATLMHASQSILMIILGVFSYLMLILQRKQDQNEKHRTHPFQNH
ncbi:MAG: flippase-like domain-containing protein [Bacteroidales bacterium]|nr:flippase-like domain-containing protein [Bacteroidales bacterium]MCF8398295.1 flippase-like domain-containing protein [Bacteroidales bacterium]